MTEQIVGGNDNQKTNPLQKEKEKVNVLSMSSLKHPLGLSFNSTTYYLPVEFHSFPLLNNPFNQHS